MDGRLTKLPQGMDQVLQVDPEPEALERGPLVGHSEGQVARAAADLLHAHQKTGRHLSLGGWELRGKSLKLSFEALSFCFVAT